MGNSCSLVMICSASVSVSVPFYICIVCIFFFLLLFNVDDCRRAFRDRSKAEQVKVTSLTGYSRSLPAAYCGVAASHGDDDVIRTPMTVLPPYSDDGQLTQEYKSQSGSASVVGDALLQQLLPNASTSSSASSTSSSTWRPLTSTTDLWSSTQRGRATTGPRGGRMPPAGRPLPAPPPTYVDGDRGVEHGDDLTAIPRVDRHRLHHVDSLGAGHFGEVNIH